MIYDRCVVILNDMCKDPKFKALLDEAIKTDIHGHTLFCTNKVEFVKYLERKQKEGFSPEYVAACFDGSFRKMAQLRNEANEQIKAGRVTRLICQEYIRRYEKKV